MDISTATPTAVGIALGISLLAGLSTGFGGLIVALKRAPGAGFLAGALGFSAGVMVYISFVELLPQGIEGLAEAGSPRAELWGTVAFFAGIGLIALIDRLVPEEINPHEEPSESGVSKAQLRSVGVLSAVAIAIHNIPEGIAVAVPMREATGSRRKAAWWATLSGLAEPLGAIVGYLLLQPFLGPQSLGITFAAIAGIMVFVSLDKLLPTAIQTGKHHTAIYGMIVGMIVMAFSLLILPG
ncbi:ZIP family metal transporter [uncultured Corynebacterium sp.]|uniref:ZIP family metal transporter n=1 Tax=uncultured Corynebacterium sp. TaxID=159447 RepID=UPI002593BD08|nr:ZIP family metal transporter [uncultured Corynebacterium sp.]